MKPKGPYGPGPVIVAWSTLGTLDPMPEPAARHSGFVAKPSALLTTGEGPRSRRVGAHDVSARDMASRKAILVMV